MKPYSSLFHPHKSWVDIFLSLIFPFLLPVAAVAAHPPLDSSVDAQHVLSKLRKDLCKLEISTVVKMVKEWASLCGCQAIVECECSIPINTKELAAGFDFLQPHEKPEGNHDDDSTRVIVRYPSSLFPSKAFEATKLTEMGLVDGGAASFDFSEVPLDVPLVVWFHGGGMIMGHARDPYSTELIIDAFHGLAAQEGDNKSPPLLAVTASVDYRLAPEHPFPAAVMDAVSVVVHILKSNPQRQVHLAGSSAGANLAAVCAMEVHRMQPGRIQSAICIAPMFDPAADSMSYYLNSPSSGLCPVSFLQWSWRAYLGMDPDDASMDGDNDDVPVLSNADDDDVPVLSNESTQSQCSGSVSNNNNNNNSNNRHAWEKCRWKQDPVARRLIEPYTDLPADLSIKFVVATNKADPLMDDGLGFVRALKTAGADVTHIDAKGSHVFGFQFDDGARNQLRQVCAKLLFGQQE